MQEEIAMRRVGGAILAIIGIALGGLGAFAIGAALIDMDNPYNGFNFAYGIPALGLGAAALFGAWRLYRRRESRS
jgi:hypothetical protein